MLLHLLYIELYSFFPSFFWVYIIYLLFVLFLFFCSQQFTLKSNSTLTATLIRDPMLTVRSTAHTITENNKDRNNRIHLTILLLSFSPLLSLSSSLFQFFFFLLKKKRTQNIFFPSSDRQYFNQNDALSCGFCFTFFYTTFDIIIKTTCVFFYKKKIIIQ